MNIAITFSKKFLTTFRFPLNEINKSSKENKVKWLFHTKNGRLLDLLNINAHNLRSVSPVYSYVTVTVFSVYENLKSTQYKYVGTLITNIPVNQITECRTKQSFFSLRTSS